MGEPSPQSTVARKSAAATLGATVRLGKLARGSGVLATPAMKPGIVAGYKARSLASATAAVAVACAVEPPGPATVTETTYSPVLA